MTFNLKQVVQRCLNGQQAAMSELVTQFHPLVFSMCLKMLGQRQDAEEVTQETFFRVIKNLDRWDVNRKFEPWLLTIAGNRCRTKLSQKHRKNPMKTLDFPVQDAKVDLEQGQILEEVNLALTDLRDEYREVFQRFHFLQESYEEISRAMNIPQGTVKTWCHRARRDIVQILARRENMPEVCAHAHPSAI